jgi:hypothetical protein
MDLQQISDRHEITDVLTRYTRAIDTHDWDALDTVFTPDAQIDYSATGGTTGGFAKVKTWLAETLPAIFPKYQHLLGQLDITLDGDTATCAAYFFNPMLMDDGQGGTKVVEVGGLCHHQLVRTADGWRSRALREELIWQRGF